MCGHLVVAVDGSDEAGRAARYGIRFARAFDAAVTVLSVVERAAANGSCWSGWTREGETRPTARRAGCERPLRD